MNMHRRKENKLEYDVAFWHILSSGIRVRDELPKPQLRKIYIYVRLCQKIGLIAKRHLKLKTQAPLHTYLNDELHELLQFEERVKEFHNISILHITF